MTPSITASQGGLPEYARQDVAASSIGAAPLDPAAVQSIDPSQPGFIDPNAVGYAPNAASVDSYGMPVADPYAGIDATAPEYQYGSAVAGVPQPREQSKGA